VTLLTNVLWTLMAILASPYILFKMITAGKYREGLAQRMGKVPARKGSGPCIWIHGVSVGEVNAARKLIEELGKAFPDTEIVISTVTNTGQEVARKAYPGCVVFYFPLDLSWIVRRFLEALAPRCVILMELELWPNFLMAAKAFGIPVVVANGRITKKSFWWYHTFWPFVRRAFNAITLFCVQSKDYAERLRRLGFADERVRVLGNVKFDTVELSPNPDRIRHLRIIYGLDDDAKVVVAGSTHEPEEATILASFKQWQAASPTLRLIIVPRHKERFDAVARLIERTGLRWARRSRLETGPPASPPQVILVDSMGELGLNYSLADVVFVGGSLIPHGGQNMLESVAQAKATLFGPHTSNFRDVVELLLKSEAVVQVRNRDELARAVARLLASPAERSRLGENGRRIVLAGRGATARHVDAIKEIIAGNARGGV